jgi:hypothetical protein
VRKSSFFLLSTLLHFPSSFSLFLSPIPSNAHCSLEEEETGHKFPLRHRYINQSTNTPSRTTDLWNFLASSSSSEKSTCLPACLEDKSFCNGEKESWRSKKKPQNALNHDQNMAFCGSIMQKYYRGVGVGENTTQMKIAIVEEASGQKLLLWAKSGRSNRWKFGRRAVTERNLRGKFESSRECAFFFRQVLVLFVLEGGASAQRRRQSPSLPRTAIVKRLRKV